MKNFVKNGQMIDYTASADQKSGDLIIANDIVGVAVTDIANGETGAIALHGIYSLAKASGAIGLGAKVYWNATDKNVTTTATNNTYIGVAGKSAVTGDTLVNVLLKAGV